MTLHFYWEDKAIPFVEGESIGYAIFRNTKIDSNMGLSPVKQEYSLFCGIGSCQGCLVYIEGYGITESCLTNASPDLKVRAIRDQDRVNLQSSGDRYE